jgi:glutamate-ammonia-ligase adenylyltransferase
MATAGPTTSLTLDLLSNLCDQLAEYLPRCPDPDMALNNLERYVRASRSPLALGALFERDPASLENLVQILSSSQHFSNLLIRDPESYDLLRMTDGQPVAREVLVEEIKSEVLTLNDSRDVRAALWRFKQREILRIGYGDLIRRQPLDVITRQISYLADAITEAALNWARRTLEQKRGVPRGPNGTPARFVVLGMGKLGGCELNYSSDIDLICLFDTEGQTDGHRSITNQEFFDRLAQEFQKLISGSTDLGVGYRVDFRLRPEGSRGPLSTSLERALQYYDVLGRTWERQAFVKARPVAGDLKFGSEFLERLEPWIYRRYLSVADISGIKALKRRIEERAIREGAESHNVKTGHGGIRDIEFVIQFLQLLNGSELPGLRTPNTLTAIAELAAAGCLTHQESTLLEKNYCFLRHLEHRLQIMFDLQTHMLPEDPRERRRFAIRMGYHDHGDRTALKTFEDDFQRCTQLNHRILKQLLFAFPDDAETDPAVDLVLDPDPPAKLVDEVLSRYGFKQPAAALRHLQMLSEESIPFLSTRRCRHFLASIAPQLLEAISSTPDPDATLVTLEKVSDSLGGKEVLWELFSFNPPSLKLYVELCSSSPYLASILTSNPGMIDELMDSLVLNRLPTLQELHGTLTDLCRRAEDIDPILHSFKNAAQLSVAVRDILDKEDIEATTGALSDIAQVCVEQITRTEHEKLVEKLGEPTILDADGQSVPCEIAILAMGKFGGRELNYHSDLDLIFLYQAEGNTAPRRPSRRVQSTTNQHFFSELGQRVIKMASRLGPQGRLYEIDPRLRPTGRSGALAVNFEGFWRYFAEGVGQLWERQALCKARPIYASPTVLHQMEQIVEAATFSRAWNDEDADAILEMRTRLEESVAGQPDNIKRGPGGLVDIEFLAQMMQLKNGQAHPTVRASSTLSALASLHALDLLNTEDFEFLTTSYRFLRTLESRLRLMSDSSRNTLPEEPLELQRLAQLMMYETVEQLVEDCRGFFRGNREVFSRLFRQHAGR